MNQQDIIILFHDSYKNIDISNFKNIILTNIN